MKPKTKGIRRILNASIYSWRGLKSAWLSEAAVRQEVFLIALLLPTALFLPVTAVEKALLIFSVLLILLTELINSAIEAAIDRIGLEHHPLSGKAKDIGSAAVLIAIIMAAIVWGLILLSYWLL